MTLDTKQISKFLSFVLRHKPEEIGIELSKDGWVKTSVLIDALNSHDKSITLEMLENVVATNNKKRFAFNEDKSMIRASQGHSIQIDLGYQEKKPPAILYHGTASKNQESIETIGLDKRNRHHVHLSADLETALMVGQRHGKPIIYSVDTAAMLRDDFKFYQSENGVWLTDAVPSKYLTLNE